MTARWKFSVIIAVSFALGAVGFLRDAAADLTPQQERGRVIYFSGTSPSGGQITAYFGKDLLEIPGEHAACSTCHGYDGLGRPESGIIPSNVTWSYLMKSYGHIHPDGFEHAAFTIDSLKRYMKEGIYPGEKRGDPAMPIYALSDQDLDDLLAFLMVIETYHDPGLTDKSVRIGIVYPDGGPQQETGRAMEHIISAYFRRLNEQGGMYGRKLELVPVSVSAAAESGKETLSAAISRKDLFALVSPFVPGRDQELTAAAEEEKIPMIGPVTLFPLETTSVNRYVFYIFSGLTEHLLALADFASAEVKLSGRAAMLLMPSRSSMKVLKAALGERAQKLGWKGLLVVEYGEHDFDPEKIARQLKGENAEALIFVGGEREFRSLTAAIERSGWKGGILVPGVLVGGAIADVPRGLAANLAVAYPTAPSDRKEEGVKDLLLLSEGLSGSPYEVTRISAYVSARLLAEGLSRSGKVLSREDLVLSLESIHAFRTGLTPELGFSQNKRIGAFGAYIVTFSPVGGRAGLQPASLRWISLE